MCILNKKYKIQNLKYHLDFHIVFQSSFFLFFFLLKINPIYVSDCIVSASVFTLLLFGISFLALSFSYIVLTSSEPIVSFS